MLLAPSLHNLRNAMGPPAASSVGPGRALHRSRCKRHVHSRALFALVVSGALVKSKGRKSQCLSSVGGAEVCESELIELGQPSALWQHFAAISNIPRASKQEERVLQYLMDFADTRGLRREQDAYGNLMIYRPGSGGGEAADPVMVQGHVDMVCEKTPTSSHDFSQDPIRLRVDGEWLRATDTTLGADNGVGVAASLAVLEMGPETKLPPIEALFTVDEETGLVGASKLNGSMISAKRMLNLDSEEWGDLCIGCAGGGDSTLEISASTEHLPAQMTTLRLDVAGLLGGHSGVTIHEYKGNAVLMAAAVAADVLAKVPNSRLVLLEGGDKRNAIPREAHAVVAVPDEETTRVHGLVSTKGDSFRAEFGLVETGLTVTCTVSTSDDQPSFSTVDSKRILSAVRVLPHGPLKMSHAMPGLVETSNNVAAVHTTSNSVQVLLSTRSSIGPALEAARDRLQAIADLAGGHLERRPAYPGWAPAPKAELVTLAASKLAARAGKDPEISAIHAGLECGLLLEKCPSISEAVSFGPTIVGAHSPAEALEISTVSPFFDALLDILGDLAEVKSM